MTTTFVILGVTIVLFAMAVVMWVWYPER